MTDPEAQITQLLNAPAGEAAEGLMPLVYEQLRHAAAAQLRAEGPGHTLQPTALVHEAYARIAGPREVPWANRGHYYAAAAQAMRRILIDHARSKGARKAREADVQGIGDIATLVQRDPGTILAVDEALSRLEGEDSEAAAVVRLRFFAGLSVEQTAMAMGISPRTAARLWSLARAKLHGFLTGQQSEASHDA
ncbi:MAG: ECF-type sigma factor [Phycisphaerales bacterium]